MDNNYRPLDFGGLQGTPESWIYVTVDATRPDVWVISGHPDPSRNGEHPAPGDDIDDVIKFSNSRYISVRVKGVLLGGREDCCDANNRTQFCNVSADFWKPRGKYAITAKGESSDLIFSGKIVQPGREATVDLGNASDQAQGRTQRITLCLDMVDGAPVDVRVLNAWEPILHTGGRYKVNTLAKGWFNPVWRILEKLAKLLGLDI